MTGEALFLILLLVALVAAALALHRRRRRSPRRDNLALRPTSDLATATGLTPVHIRLGPPQKLAVKMPAAPVNGRRIRQGRPLVLPPVHQPLWFVKGWRKTTGRDEYRGHFDVADKQWRGLIKRRNGNDYTAFIWNPPLQQIERNTIHSACFSSSLYDDAIVDSTGCYRVHYHDQPGSLDHAIITIEGVLAEALNVKV